MRVRGRAATAPHDASHIRVTLIAAVLPCAVSLPVPSNLPLGSQNPDSVVVSGISDRSLNVAPVMAPPLSRVATPTEGLSAVVLYLHPPKEVVIRNAAPTIWSAIPVMFGSVPLNDS